MDVPMIEKPEKSLGPEWEKEGVEILQVSGAVKRADPSDSRDPKRA
jgi:hypothetical protein